MGKQGLSRSLILKGPHPATNQLYQGQLTSDVNLNRLQLEFIFHLSARDLMIDERELLSSTQDVQN